MNVGFDPSPEIEKERQRLIGEIRLECGPEWDVPYQPGSFGCHELLDRTSQLADQLEKSILDHPACIRDPEWFALATRAVNALRELYQRVGSEHL